MAMLQVSGLHFEVTEDGSKVLGFYSTGNEEPWKTYVLTWFWFLIPVIPAHGYRRIYNEKIVTLSISFPTSSPIPQRQPLLAFFFPGVYIPNSTIGLYHYFLILNIVYWLPIMINMDLPLLHVVLPSSIGPIYFYHYF